MSDLAGTAGSKEVGITVQFNAVRRRWRLVFGSVLLSLILAAVVLALLKPVYTASSQVLLDARRLNILQSQSVTQGVPLDASSVESEVSLIKSFSVARRVVEKLNLDKDVEFLEGNSLLGSILKSLRRAIGISPAGSAVQPVTAASELTPEMYTAIRRFGTNLNVRRIGITLVIELNFSSTDPEKAARICNAIASAYLVDQLEARYEAARRASDWLSDRLAGLKDQVQAAERRVAAYRSENGILDTQSGGVDRQQVTEINTQLALARAAVAEKSAKYDQARRLTASGGNMAAVADVLQSQVVSNLRTQEAEVARKEADLAARYGDRHPQVLNVRAELNDIRRAINGEVQRVVTNIKNEFDIAVKREQSLQESLERLSGVATQSDEVRIKLRELERDSETSRNLYQSFLSRFKETREQTTLETTDSRIISPAVTPTTASFPRYTIIFSVASLLGLAFGIVGALLLEYIENGFMTVEQIETLLNQPVLAVVPQMTKQEYDPGNSGLPIFNFILQKPLSRLSEAIRTVRAGVALSDVDQPPRLILVTSSVPGEGKSTFASCFAASAASSGMRVLLIDGDMRHPSTSKLFGLEKEQGLVEVLGGSIDVTQAMRRFRDSTLAILPAGSTTKNAPDLLGSQKMLQLLREFRASFDLVVIDTPPVTAVVDTLMIAGHVDKIVFLIEWENTPRVVVQRAMNVLGDNRQRLAGIVLNKANVQQLRYHNTYYGYYGSRYDKRYDKYYKE